MPSVEKRGEREDLEPLCQGVSPGDCGLQLSGDRTLPDVQREVL